jgi:hypothetical protein
LKDYYVHNELYCNILRHIFFQVQPPQQSILEGNQTLPRYPNTTITTSTMIPIECPSGRCSIYQRLRSLKEQRKRLKWMNV